MWCSCMCSFDSVVLAVYSHIILYTVVRIELQVIYTVQSMQCLVDILHTLDRILFKIIIHKYDYGNVIIVHILKYLL